MDINRTSHIKVWPQWPPHAKPLIGTSPLSTSWEKGTGPLPKELSPLQLIPRKESISRILPSGPRIKYATLWIFLSLPSCCFCLCFSKSPTQGKGGGIGLVSSRY